MINGFINRSSKLTVPPELRSKIKNDIKTEALEAIADGAKFRLERLLREKFNCHVSVRNEADLMALVALKALEG